MIKFLNQMWGGCFSVGLDVIMEVINVLIGFDKCMVEQDIIGLCVYVVMLVVIGIIIDKDVEVICEGLFIILLEIEKGEF